jgi:hypothetical protein
VRLPKSLVCFAILAVAPLVAKADAVAFSLVAQGQTVTWTLPDGAPADSSSPHFAVFDNVPVLYDGMSVVATYIEFPSSLIGGGIVVNINNNPYFYGQGAQLFTGPTSAPDFLESPIPYTLTSNQGPVTVTITPEPCTFLLLGTGIAALAAARRKLFCRLA